MRCRGRFFCTSFVYVNVCDRNKMQEGGGWMLEGGCRGVASDGTVRFILRLCRAVFENHLVYGNLILINIKLWNLFGPEIRNVCSWVKG